MNILNWLTKHLKAQYPGLEQLNFFHENNERLSNIETIKSARVGELPRLSKLFFLT